MADAMEREPASRRRARRPQRRDVALGVLALAIAGGLIAILVHGSSRAVPPAAAATASPTGWAGLSVANPKPAPPLVLHNYAGGTIDIASDRGKAVLVTFLYTHCPDTCPLMASKLHTALSRLSPAQRRRVALIAVSVDPVGDTTATVSRFVSSHELTGEMQYGIGDRAALARVWSAWGVGTQRTKNPEVVEHTALIYGIDASGKIVTVYPASFTPGQVAHDVPRLAAT
jgi:protein SCO1/2